MDKESTDTLVKALGRELAVDLMLLGLRYHDVVKQNLDAILAEAKDRFSKIIK